MSRPRTARAVAIAVVVALAGCGAGDEREAPSATPTAGAGQAVDVRVTMRDAPGPDSYTARCSEAACVTRWRRLLDRAQDPTRVCTEIYGGPEAAIVRGTVGGEPVDVRFGRENGCAIRDYEDLFRLLGRPAPIGG